MSPPPKVAIIGAGPAGMTLAHLLIKASIPVTIFEGEASPHVRGQGGTLDLHDDTGLKALNEIGLLEDFQKHARYDGEAVIIADKNLKKYLYADGTTKETSRGRPEIDREKLRKILYEALPDGVIRWGSRLRSVTGDQSLQFDHGIETGYDLIVGADGAWSKVRPLLSEVQPFYSGLGGIHAVINDAEKQHPDLYKLVNRGSVFCYSDGKNLNAQQMGDGTIIVGSWTRRPEDWQRTCGYDVHDPLQAKKALLEEFQDWNPQLRALLEASDEEQLVPRNLYMLPVGHRWDHRPGFTLIGDSAHLMTPFAGEGVNLAMADALKLAQALTAARKSENSDATDKAVKAFEKEMFSRAGIIAEVTRGCMEDMLFTSGANPSTIPRYARRVLVGQLPWLEWMIPLWFVKLALRLIFKW